MTTSPHAAPEATAASRPHLALPTDWVIDELSRCRLERLLAQVEPDVAGVVAARADLPSGASYRVVAERAALLPDGERAPHDGPAVRGAVLVRAGVPFDVSDDRVTVDHGRLLVDPGAAAHDPWRAIGALAPASPHGRPPFPWRPVVLFLGFEADPDLADWVRARVNGLVRRNTEGRIAVPAPTGGLHLTRPCTPSAESVAALRPDVLVALDPRASELGSQWLGDDRSAVVIEMTRDTTSAVELVSWRIGRAHGRIRARIGRGIDAPAIEQLVRRLAAGPQPLPPRDRKRRETPAGRPQPTGPARGALDPTLRVVALLGERSAIDDARYAAFADHVDAFGGRLTVSRLDGTPQGSGGGDGLDGADVLFVRGVSADPRVHDLVRARARAGRVTVVDLGAGDVEYDGTQPSAALRLRSQARELLEVSGHALTTSPRLRSLLPKLGIRALMVPTLVTRARFSELQRRRTRERRRPAVVGWHTGSGSAATDDARAPASTLMSLLDTRTDLTVEVVGDRTGLADAVSAHDRVTVSAGSPAPDTVARWTAQLWTTPALDAQLTGDLQPAVVAHLLGVPTSAPAQNPSVHEGLVAPSLIASPDQPWRQIEELVDDEVVWARRSADVAGVADALYGPASSLAVMNRLLGWLQCGAAR